MNHNPRGIRKVDNLYGDKVDFIDIKCLVKEINKSERNNIIHITVFGYKDPIYVSKKCYED